jgi:amidohydrolase
MLLGVARLLKDSFANDALPGTVRFIFQPAEESSDEEGLSGAPRMIEDGVMDGLDAVIALHIDSSLPTGAVSTNSGWSSAAVDSFEAWLTATGGHGAFPHESTDPIWMLGPVLTTLHGIVARRVDPMQPAVVSLGQIHTGTASNIIPAEVYLNGTLRSYESKVREQLIAEVARALAVARSLGGDFRLKIHRGYPAGWNDPRVNDWLTAVSTDLLGPEALKAEPPGMGGEDFAYMSRQVPGAMFMLGAALPDGLQRPHHSGLFDIDEEALPLGTAILAETARRFLTGAISL